MRYIDQIHNRQQDIIEDPKQIVVKEEEEIENIGNLLDQQYLKIEATNNLIDRKDEEELLSVFNNLKIRALL